MEGAQLGSCPYGSPVSGLCSSAAGNHQPNSPVPASSSQPSSAGFGRQWTGSSSVRTGPLQQLQQHRLAAASPSYKQGQQQHPQQPAASPMSWQPGTNTLTSSTHSMPELWQGSLAPHQPAGMVQHPADCRQSRDQSASSYTSQQQQQQQLSSSMPLFPPADRQQQCLQLHPQQQQQHQHASSSWETKHVQLQDQQHQQQQPYRPASTSGADDRAAPPQQGGVQRVPKDVLLSPLLPSADESKLLERLSQLRVALDEQQRLAASWEQQVKRFACTQVVSWTYTVCYAGL